MSEDNANKIEALEKRVCALEAALALALKPEHRPANIEQAVLKIVEDHKHASYSTLLRGTQQPYGGITNNKDELARQLAQSPNPIGSGLSDRELSTQDSALRKLVNKLK